MSLKRERAKAGLTQDELARLAKVAQPTISKIESGKLLDPRYETVARLAWALNKCGRKLDPVDLMPRRQPLLIKGARSQRHKGRRSA